MSGLSDHWQGVYSAKAEGEVSWFQAHPGPSLGMIAAAGLPPGASLIDVGGGASRLVDALLGLGFRMTVLDLAAAALDKARTRLGEQARAVEWVVADVTRWTPPARYDLWHDRAVFHFLAEEDARRAYAAAMAAAVRPGGQAVVATFGLGGPERCSGLPVCRYDAAGLAAQFADGFRLVDAAVDLHLTPAGKEQRFQFCRFVRH